MLSLWKDFRGIGNVPDVHLILLLWMGATCIKRDSYCLGYDLGIHIENSKYQNKCEIKRLHPGPQRNYQEIVSCFLELLPWSNGLKCRGVERREDWGSTSCGQECTCCAGGMDQALHPQDLQPSGCGFEGSRL